MRKFKFSRELRDAATIEMTREHLLLNMVLADEMQSLQIRMEREQREFMERLCGVQQFPRSLTPIFDPNHLAEHGVVYLTSQEVEDQADEPPKETKH